MDSVATLDLISCADARTLPGLFARRHERTPDGEAYRQFDRSKGTWRSYTWRDAGALLARWQASLAKENLAAGERVAICLPNSLEWVCYDLAAQSLGLIVVPLYTADNPENWAFILENSGACLLLVGDTSQWQILAPQLRRPARLSKILCMDRSHSAHQATTTIPAVFVEDWLVRTASLPFNSAIVPDSVATIVYTSGTTGPPKGVMLTHRNVLSDAEAVLKVVPGYREDVFLSFLPLSHTFERTIGYYLPMMSGSCVAYSRSLKELPLDLLAVQPTVLISVPRIYELMHAKIQESLAQRGEWARLLFRWTQEIGWKRFRAVQGHGEKLTYLERVLWQLLRHLVARKILSRLGGHLRLAITGGAAMSPVIARCFLSLGLTLLQGYGLTEASPVVTANRLDDNVPDSVGFVLPGVEIRLGDKDELLVRGPSVMQGYWGRPSETASAIDAEGWLHTGDVARIVEDRVYIVGRLKEIIVMSTGEKVPPADVELALTRDPMFAQAMVIGEGKPFLAALIVLEPEGWRKLASDLLLDASDATSLSHPLVLNKLLEVLKERLRHFPAYARIRRVWLTLEPWTIENGLLTPTLKLKRSRIEQRFAQEIQTLYAKHAIAEEKHQWA